ncbi:MAG: hybrid sensor histidine kinase/response regulator [Calditrichaeota bacterium]|nr:MAG: hybrid sensor histidine kinase/response regulator [Calditrichota bacterium]
MYKILVIEDEKMTAKSLVKILEKANYIVSLAYDGLEGIEKIKEEEFDLVISDIAMPKKDGYQVLEEVRKNPTTLDLPFIFLTSQDIAQNVQAGNVLGADDFITKPFQKDELLAVIKNRLERHSAHVKQLDDLRMNLSFILPHELRTPLTSIIGFGQLLSEPAMLPKPDEVAKIGKTVYRSGIRLFRLVENHLLYLNLKISESLPEKRKFWQQGIIYNTKFLLKNTIEAKAKEHNRLEDLELRLTDYVVKISEVNLKKITEEIVDNAFKFSQKGAKVKVESEVDQENFLIKISNEGREMTTEQIAEIGAFMQFDRPRYEKPGCGLGLEIAKILINFNEGNLKIESENSLTTVTVKIPLAKEKIKEQ